jgi:hypothetical protein
MHMATVGNYLPRTDRTQPLGQSLANVCQNLVVLGAQLTNLYDIMAQLQAGGSDYTGIELYFGGLAAGQGITLIGLVNAAQQQLATSQIQGLLQRYS